MRLQIEQQSMRFRIGEAELTGLLAGDTISDVTHLPDGGTWLRQLRLTSARTASLQCAAEHWQLALPKADVLALAQRVPCRDGLRYVLAAGSAGELEIRFDIDVRQRGPSGHGPSPE